MLIDQNTVIKLLKEHNIDVSGIFHIGAHECEELRFYERMNISSESIIWIDAMQSKVNEAKQKGIKNIYQAIVSDTDDKELTFNVTNNVQSSSILEFGTHQTQHPHVKVVSTFVGKSITVDSFFERNNLDASKLNFWNFDIQGAELLALKGAEKSLKYAKVLYLEVNKDELYKGCALLDELDKFLQERNFVRDTTVMTSHGWGDAIYIRKE